MKGQTLHDTTHVKYLEKSKSEIETKRVVAKGRIKQKSTLLLSGCSISLLQDEKVREICCTVL